MRFLFYNCHYLFHSTTNSDLFKTNPKFYSTFKLYYSIQLFAAFFLTAPAPPPFSSLHHSPPPLQPPLSWYVTRVSEVQVLGGGCPHRHPHAHLRPHRPRGRHCTTPTLDPGRQCLAPPTPPNHARALSPPILSTTYRQSVGSISHAHRRIEPIHKQLTLVKRASATPTKPPTTGNR